MILNTMDLGKVKNNQNNGVTLREYFETRMQAIEKAVEVAYTSMDARLEGMNQFRDALRDQAAKFITRDVADKTNCAVTDRTRSLELKGEEITTRIDALEKSLASYSASMDKRLESMNEFRASLKDQASTFITRTEHEFVLGQINDLKLSRAEMAGKASQKAVNVAFIISVMGIFLSIIAIIIKLFQ